MRDRFECVGLQVPLLVLAVLSAGCGSAAATGSADATVYGQGPGGVDGGSSDRGGRSDVGSLKSDKPDAHYGSDAFLRARTLRRSTASSTEGPFPRLPAVRRSVRATRTARGAPVPRWVRLRHAGRGSAPTATWGNARTARRLASRRTRDSSRFGAHARVTPCRPQERLPGQLRASASPPGSGTSPTCRLVSSRTRAEARTRSRRIWSTAASPVRPSRTLLLRHRRRACRGRRTRLRSTALVASRFATRSRLGRLPAPNQATA